MVETGHFASLWNKMAHRLGIKTEFLKTDQRGAMPEKIYERLKKDTEQQIKAVCVVHNETSTGAPQELKKSRCYKFS